MRGGCTSCGIMRDPQVLTTFRSTGLLALAVSRSTPTLVSRSARANSDGGGPRLAREEALTVEHFLLRPGRVHRSAKFAAVPHAMRKPACELLHFANTIGQVGSINFRGSSPKVNGAGRRPWACRNGRWRRTAPSARRSTGLVAAARPIITASQPVSRTMRSASSGMLTSPLPITGILHGLLDGGDQVPVGAAACSLARACADAPRGLRRRNRPRVSRLRRRRWNFRPTRRAA